MVESIGLAGIAEIPVVLVNVQRPDLLLDCLLEPNKVT